MEQHNSPGAPDFRNYNILRKPLKQPEYGRLVMQMVEHALQLEDKEQRQACAENIVRIMAGTNPQLKKTPNYKLKLWEHLAYMADYKLDIDYPVEISNKEKDAPIKKLSYPARKIKLRHYGNLMEQLMERIENMPESPTRDAYIKAAGERMKRNLHEWKNDVPENERVAEDIALYTAGKVAPEEVMTLLQHSKTSYNKTRKGKR